MELVLASAEVTTLVRRRQPSLTTLQTLLEVQPFPGLEPESEFLYSALMPVFILKCYLL